MVMRPVQQETPQHGAGAASPGTPATVALLTKDESLLKSVTSLLDAPRYRVSPQRGLQAMFGLLLDRRTDTALLDLRFTAETHVDVGKWVQSVSREPTIPVIGLCGNETSQGARLAALEAGLWDVVELPRESSEFVAKLQTWIRLKQSFDGLRSGNLLDVETGHYSSQGMKRRLRELVALAQRSGDSLSCVLFGADPVPEKTGLSPEALAEAGKEFSLALHHQTRNSDVVGRLEPLKFMVLAPQTVPSGAVRFAERFTSFALSRRVEGKIPVTFSAGVAGVDGRNGQVQACPELLLTAAGRALNAARASGVAQVSVAWGTSN